MRPSPVAPVTGANRGIGLEVCRQLAQNQMRVFLEPVREDNELLELLVNQGRQA